MKKTLLATLPLLLLAVAAIGQQAKVHIANTSGRTLTIKVMKDLEPTGDTLYSILSVLPYGRATESFAETGHFHLKMKAELMGTEAIYTKGDPFEVYVGLDGYSEITITISITESNVLDPMIGKQISKSEFDRN